MRVKKMLEDIFQPAGGEDIVNRTAIRTRYTEALAKELSEYLPNQYPRFKFTPTSYETPAWNPDKNAYDTTGHSYFLNMRNENNRLSATVHITSDFVEVMYQNDSHSWDIPLSETDKKDLYRTIEEYAQLLASGKNPPGYIDEDIFKAADKKELARRDYEKWKQGRHFPFLQHIDPQEVLSKGYGSLKDIPLDPQERSEIWVKHGVEINIYYDEDEIVKDFFDVIPSLTQEYNESKLSPEEWLKTIPGARVLYSGYSGNEDPAYFWGGDFSYVVFNYDHADYMIMKDKVMEGDFEEFWHTLSQGEPQNEIAYLLGYQGDYDLLEKDIKKWYESDGEIVKDEPDPNTDPMQLRFPFMDEPVRG